MSSQKQPDENYVSRLTTTARISLFDVIFWCEEALWKELQIQTGLPPSPLNINQHINTNSADPSIFCHVLKTQNIFFNQSKLISKKDDVFSSRSTLQHHVTFKGNSAIWKDLKWLPMSPIPVSSLYLISPVTSFSDFHPL